MKKGFFLLLVIILMLIRILAWLGLLFGIIFFITGNFTRGIEFFLAGLLLTGIKYLYGYLFAIAVGKDYE